jgi:hypothetical protein
MSGPARVEVQEGWRKLHGKLLNLILIPPNILRIINSRNMRWDWAYSMQGI